MTIRKYLPLILLFSLLAACGSDNEKASPEAPANGSAPATTQPATAPAAPGNTPAPATQQIALNPAHGLPGHRCDIPVGAPLNSPPGKTSQTATPVQAAPVQTTTSVNPSPGNGVSNPGSAATGLNPAHGQPGHRCDIAVGAPLNSKSLKQ